MISRLFLLLACLAYAFAASFNFDLSTVSACQQTTGCSPSSFGGTLPGAADTVAITASVTSYINLASVSYLLLNVQQTGSAVVNVAVSGTSTVASLTTAANTAVYVSGSLTVSTALTVAGNFTTAASSTTAITGASAQFTSGYSVINGTLTSTNAITIGNLATFLVGASGTFTGGVSVNNAGFFVDGAATLNTASTFSATADIEVGVSAASSAVLTFATAVTLQCPVSLATSLIIQAGTTTTMSVNGNFNGNGTLTVDGTLTTTTNVISVFGGLNLASSGSMSFGSTNSTMELLGAAVGKSITIAGTITAASGNGPLSGLYFIQNAGLVSISSTNIGVTLQMLGNVSLVFSQTATVYRLYIGVLASGVQSNSTISAAAGTTVTFTANSVLGGQVTQFVGNFVFPKLALSGAQAIIAHGSQFTINNYLQLVGYGNFSVYGGSVYINNAVSTAISVGASASLNVYNGFLNISNNINIAAGGFFNILGGTVSLGSGYSLIANAPVNISGSANVVAGPSSTVNFTSIYMTGGSLQILAQTYLNFNSGNSYINGTFLATGQNAVITVGASATATLDNGAAIGLVDLAVIIINGTLTMSSAAVLAGDGSAVPSIFLTGTLSLGTYGATPLADIGPANINAAINAYAGSTINVYSQAGFYCLGGSTISGTLSILGGSFIALNGTININNAISVAGIFVSAATVIVSGSYTQTAGVLYVANDYPASPPSAFAGVLVATSVSVSSGAYLGGVGEINTPALTMGGIFQTQIGASSAPYGTLYVTGTVTLTTSALYNVTVYGVNMLNNLVAGGSVTLNGALNVNYNAAYTGNGNLTLISTNGTSSATISGTFAPTPSGSNVYYNPTNTTVSRNAQPSGSTTTTTATATTTSGIKSTTGRGPTTNAAGSSVPAFAIMAAAALFVLVQ